MEVVTAENAPTVENQANDKPQVSQFTWKIENFSRLKTKKLYSDAFVVGNYNWRVLIFPKGNNVDYLSIYLDVADSATLPNGWSRHAQFTLAVVNQIHSKDTIKKDTQHQFNQRESDWGFTSFIPLSDLYDPSKGYLVNDLLVVEAVVTLHNVDNWTYDSKKETGYVGLKKEQYLGLEHSDTTPKMLKIAFHHATKNEAVTHNIRLPKQSTVEDFVIAQGSNVYGAWEQYLGLEHSDTTEMNHGLPSIIEGAEQRVVPSAPARGEQSHTIPVDDDVVEEIASELEGVRNLADEIQHIMNLELEEAAPHISSKLQMILIKIKNSTAEGLTPTLEAQLQNLMWAAQDLGIDYVGAESAKAEFEQSTKVYHEMDEMVLKAKNAMAITEASMTTLRAKFQETLAAEVEAEENIRRAKEEIRKALAKIKESKRLQETYTNSLNLKCSELEQLDKEYKVWERRVARSLPNRQVYEQRGSRAERKLNAARRSWEDIKKTWAELEAVLPAEVYITAGQPTMSDSSIRSPGEE